MTEEHNHTETPAASGAGSELSGLVRCSGADDHKCVNTCQHRVAHKYIYNEYNDEVERCDKCSSECIMVGYEVTCIPCA